jgi:phosphoenolpyruvate-protein kinase (PTS system EI component)
MLPFLLGVGLRKFSIDIINAPTVQRLVRSCSLEKAEFIAERMLGCGRISEVEAFLDEQELGLAPAS